MLASSKIFAQNIVLPETIPSDMQQFIVDVYLNNEKMTDVALLLEDKNRHVYMSGQQLVTWKILLPVNPSLTLDGVNYYNISNLSGINYEFSESDLSLTMDLPASDFQKSIINSSSINKTIIRPTQSGMYMNYDATILHNQLQAQNNIAGTAEFAYFNHGGVGDTTFLLQNQTGQDIPNINSVSLSSSESGTINETTPSSPIVRLNTTWTLDKPEDMATWRFGDSITGTSSWTGAVRFGGVQYSTNFSTQPNFVTFPLPSFEGEAVVPTTVNFLLNNQLQQSNQVNTGPFDIQGVPVITGAGNLIVQTTDILGRQTTLAIPYYASPALLKEGVKNFSYEMGAVRNNYGIDSNDYGSPLIVGSWEEGITNKLTAGWHGELLPDQQTFGLSSTYNLYNFGILSAATAASHANRGQGVLGQLGFQRLTTLTNIGGQIIATTPNFDQLGLNDDQLSPSLTSQAYASYSPARLGSFSISYTSREGRSEDSIALVTVSYTRNLPYHAYLMLSAVKTVQGSPNNQFYLTLSWSPAPSYTLSGTFGNQTGGSQSNIAFSKNLPAGNGDGYRLLASPGINNQLEGDYYLQTDHGLYTAMASQIDGTNNFELDASGGVVRFASDTFFTRPVDDSFIVAQIPGFSNVRVYSNNQLITTTDKHGNAFIPHALPYQENKITLNSDDLPMNAQIQTDALNAYPYYRSGTLVKFPVYATQSFQFSLLNNHNKPLTAGTSVSLEGVKVPAIVGYNGMVFIQLTNAKALLHGSAELDNQTRCRFDLILPKTKNTLTNLGNIICQ